MKYPALTLAALGAILGALGQVCFKYGAEGRSSLGDFVNIWIVFGLLFYGVGTIVWIMALSTAPLTVIYPFTALTYVLVNIFGITILGEHISANVIAGVAFVLLGLFVMAK